MLRRGVVVTAAALSAFGVTSCGGAQPVAAPSVASPAETWTQTATPTSPASKTATSAGTMAPSSPSELSPTQSSLPTHRVTSATSPGERTGGERTSGEGTGGGRSVAAGAFERPSRGGVVFGATGQGRLSGHRVAVDPGHNGVYDARIAERQVPAGNGGRKACNTSGTANSAMSEHELTWEVASLLVAELRAGGATVAVTRPDDHGVGPCVDERAAIGNRAGAELVISIHADGNESPTARGFHVITSATMKGGPEAEARSQDLAALVRDRMVGTGMPISTYLGRRGIDVRSDIAGVNLSEPPAVMLEMGNMHHPKDAALFSEQAFRGRVAAVLADAVTAALD